MPRIAVVGTGYVGLVTGACLSDFGVDVICVDNDTSKIEKLNQGIIPIFEPGLNIIVERNVYYKRLKFTSDIKSAIEASDVIFIAVGTPPKEDGSADLKYVYEVADSIAKHINGYKVVVNKSTVPVGTGKAVKDFIKSRIAPESSQFEFDVVSNPEFLREGSAIYDFTHPDRVVIGSDTKKAMDIMKEVYRVLYLNETPFVETNVETAEVIKYASNAFLAMKITFINEMAILCENAGANIQDVAKAIGRDGRIGPKFLHPGPGYGGSCFPKDTKALVEIARKYNSRVSLIEATISANENHKRLMVTKIENQLGDLKGKTLAVLGLAFKQNTDDMRDSASITIINELYNKGAGFKVYDPQAMHEAQGIFSAISDKMQYCHDEYEAVIDADAVIILTEWNQFRNLDLPKIKNSLKAPVFFDFRNIYHRDIVEKHGFKYIAVGQ